MLTMFESSLRDQKYMHVDGLRGGSILMSWKEVSIDGLRGIETWNEVSTENSHLSLTNNKIAPFVTTVV